MTAPRPSPRPRNSYREGYHRCPCGCGNQVPDRLLACRDGWYRLPRHIRALFDHGKGRRSDEQFNALGAAVQWYADNPRPGSGSQ